MDKTRAPLGPDTLTSTPAQNPTAPLPSPDPTIPAPPRTPPRSTGPYATMNSGYLGTTASTSGANQSSRMLVDELSGDGPSAFLETPCRACLIPLPRSPTPTIEDLRPEPVADWLMDVEEEEGGREARGESEGEKDLSVMDGMADPGARRESEEDEEKSEEKRDEAKKEEGVPKGRESRRVALRDKNALQAEGAVSTRSIPPARRALRVRSAVSSSDDELLLRPNPPPPPSQMRRTTKTSLHL